MPYAEINITMGLISSLVVGILIFSQLGKRNKTHQDWFFICMLGIHIICTLSDAVNWAFDTRPGKAFRMMTMTGNFLAYFMSAIAYIPFILYIIEAAFPKKKAGYGIFWTACSVSAVMAVISVVNLFNGMLYTIDENNYFHWGEWDWFFNLLVLIQLILVFIQILRCRSALDRRDMTAFMVYEILPVLAILISIFPIELTLVYPATMLSLLLLYVNVQQELEKRLARKELELMEKHTSVMLSQIQPHFLYNALLAVENLCGTDSAKAQKAVNDFAKYLRGNMKALTQRCPVPFKEELKHIQHYLNLEKLRFGSKLSVVMEIGATKFLIPVLSVQPIVENAIKHGISCRKEGGTVLIRTEDLGQAWLVTVKDDGVGFNPSDAGLYGKDHIGIVNVRERLNSLSGGRLEIESCPGEGTVAKIIIPKEETGDDCFGGR